MKKSRATKPAPAPKSEFTKLPTAYFTITINQFRPMGVGFPISASIVAKPGNPKFITIQGENITVKGEQPVKLVFDLPNPAPSKGYVLLGIAFASNTVDMTVGLHTFPTVTIDREPTTSILTVADHPQPVGVQRYDYVMLVQSISTGEIGMIDPAMINEPGGPGC